MGLFDFFRNKKDNVKCEECMRSLKSGIFVLEGRNYCQECYNRRITLIRQTGGTPAAAQESSRDNNIQGTFVCGGCKKTLPLKYRRRSNLCAACSEEETRKAEKLYQENRHRINTAPPAAKAPEKQEAAQREFHLGDYSFTDAERQRVKTAAMRFMQLDLSSVEAQRELLKSLSPVMHIALVQLKTDIMWKIPENLPEEEKRKRFTAAFAGTVLTVDQTLAALNPEHLIKMAALASSEELLKAWIVLDYYANSIKPEYTKNIRHFCDFIHNSLLQFENPQKDSLPSPVQYKGSEIHIDSAAFYEWKKSSPLDTHYEATGVFPLSGKEPCITLIEDGVKTQEYCLQAEGDENWDGKYFLISTRISLHGNPAVPAAQIDGFFSDTPEDRKMTDNDIGYRFEVHFLACGGENALQRREMNRGQDLPMKALRYPGYTTPANVRLIGVCRDCGKSFAFHSYAFYMAQSDVAYSDDGQDCCEIRQYDIDKGSWSFEYEGKTYRYYNSFCCPHCGAPYIDYRKYPQNKKFGVCGCVHLGRKSCAAE